MQFLWEYLKTANKPILLYGTGNGADKIIDRLLFDGVLVSGVFASDGFVRNRSFRGFDVISYSKAKADFKDFIVLVAFGSKRPEVVENVEKIAGAITPVPGGVGPMTIAMLMKNTFTAAKNSTK